MSSTKVIVFGPTGAVGSSVARTASSLGASVTLAMRDPSKPIPGLSASVTSTNRVPADLTKPETVLSAVKSSGAKHAFMYLMHGATDGMRGTVEALKAGGVELVVFLSSFSLAAAASLEELRAIPEADVIGWAHAQVEISLFEVFGREGYVAARPGSFASNTLGFAGGVRDGTVRAWQPQARIDAVASEDVGKVCGSVLVKGVPADGQRLITILGPECMTLEQALRRIAAKLGRQITIKAATEEEARKLMVEEQGIPAGPTVDLMIRQGYLAVKSSTEEDMLNIMGWPAPREALMSVERYAGVKAKTLEEWVEDTRAEWEGV